MSKTLWHTIKIEVPKEMVEITKSGRVSVKKTLTKMFNVSKSNKQPAIELKPADVNKPKILNDGKEWNVEELKARMKKANTLKNKSMKQKEKTVIESVVNALRKNKEMNMKKKLSPTQLADVYYQQHKDDIQIEFVKMIKKFMKENKTMAVNAALNQVLSEFEDSYRKRLSTKLPDNEVINQIMHNVSNDLYVGKSSKFYKYASKLQER